MKVNLPVLLICALAILLRLYNLPGNFTIDGDSGRDVMIAHEAIRRGEIPLTGPFTSAGPFVFGPFFYWFITASYLLLPFGLLSPWVLLFIVAIAFVFLMMVIGDQLGGKKLAIIIGLLSATSPQMVQRSRVLTQHTLVAISAAVGLLCYVLLWKRKRALFAFLLGGSLGIALSLHYQAINLLLFLPAVFLVLAVNWKTKILYLVVAAIGFLLPSLPLLFWDSQQNFANVRNILDFLLIGQYRIYVPTSWKLFLFQQFPSYLTFVVGGLLPVGLILFFAGIIGAVRSRGVVFILAVIYLILLFVNRYYHGERFEGYLIYFVPFVLLFSGILLEKLGTVALAIVLVLNIWATTQILADNPYNFSVIAKQAAQIRKFYGNKVSVYQNNPNSSLVAYPLYLALQESGAIGQEGSVPLGVLLDTSPAGFHFVDLRQGTPGQWGQVSQKGVYDDLIGWLQKHQLPSSFDLKKYLLEKLP